MTEDTRIRIVIAEDDGEMRSALRDFLDAEDDITVVGVAVDAREGAAMSIETRPDIAILDVRMPEGGGPVAAQAIADRCPQVAMIALTAGGDDRTRAEMLARGASDVLVKGGDPEELLRIVRSVATQARAAAAVPRAESR